MSGLRLLEKSLDADDAATINKERASIPGIRRREKTTWEHDNVILKEFVKELIALGADPDLYLISFQIWALYLQATKVAFFSKEEKMQPMLPGIGFKQHDMKVLYNVAQFKSDFFINRKFKNPAKRKRIKNDSDTFEEDKFVLDEKYLNVPFYGRKADESKSDEKIVLKFDRSEMEKLALMMASAADVSNATNNEHRQKLKHDILHKIYSRTAASKNITFVTIIAIACLALYLTRDEIFVADIVRWINEGRLSIAKVRSFRTHLKKVKRVAFRREMKMIASSVLEGKLDVQKPDMEALAGRYCRDLQLPGEFARFVAIVMKMRPPLMNYKNYTDHADRFPDFECRCMAYVLFAAKLLFSLDDETEQRQSDFADSINAKLNYNLFSWRKWVRYVECTKAVLSEFDPYKKTANREIVSYVNLWERYQPSFDREPGFYRARVHNHLNDIVERMRSRSSSSSLSEGKRDFQLPASFTSRPTSVKYLLKRKRPKLIEGNAREILKENHGDKSLKYLVDEKWCKANLMMKSVSMKKGLSENVQAEHTFEVAEKVTKYHFRDISVECSIGIEDEESSSTSSKGKLKDSSLRVVFNSSKGGSSKYDKDIRCKLNLKKKEKKNDASKNKCEGMRIKMRVVFFAVHWPCRQYWFIHEIDREIGMIAFAQLAAAKFPLSFHWLLTECSSLIFADIRDVYEHLTAVESVYMKSKYSCTFWGKRGMLTREW